MILNGAFSSDFFNEAVALIFLIGVVSAVLFMRKPLSRK